jgi:hypothetical protein
MRSKSCHIAIYPRSCRKVVWARFFRFPSLPFFFPSRRSSFVFFLKIQYIVPCWFRVDTLLYRDAQTKLQNGDLSVRFRKEVRNFRNRVTQPRFRQVKFGSNKTFFPPLQKLQTSKFRKNSNILPTLYKYMILIISQQIFIHLTIS